MLNLPETPVSTALTIGAVAAMGLIAYQSKLRAQIDTLHIDNYRPEKAERRAAKVTKPANQTDRTDIRSA